MLDVLIGDGRQVSRTEHIMRDLRVFSAVTLVAVGVTWGLLFAQNEEFPSTPILRIETGMHTAKINRLGVDAAERYIVTASDDKTARIWDLRSGKLVQILRPPQGEGNPGRLYAAAISPDGATVAVGGWTRASADSIYLFDRASGTLTRDIAGLPNVVNHLSYSRDGSFLAAALGGSGGIRVYRTDDYRETARDTQYSDSSFWLDFDRVGRLVTACDDGSLRLYSSSFRLLHKRQAPGGKNPFAARFSPDGNQVAVGFTDSRMVNVLSGQDLSFLYAPSAPQVSGSLGAVAWSRDGQILFAAGTFLGSVFRWTNAGKGVMTQWPGPRNTIMELLSLSGGRLAIASAGPTLNILDAGGKVLWQHDRESLDLASSNSITSDHRLRLSRQGDVVIFGFWTQTAEKQSQRNARFSVQERRFQFDPVDDASLPLPRSDGLNVAEWRHTNQPTLNGRALPLASNEISRALAISPTADSFLLGTDFSLRLYDHQGQQRWRAAVPGVAWDVNLTSDGRYAVAALGDGTIRWYETANGKELLALFVHRDGQRWVVWTPEGFFDASPGGEALVGYHLNQGANLAGTFINVDQVFNLFYRPDLIAQRLQPGGAEAILAARGKIGDIRAILAGGLPPELERLSPAESQSAGEFDLKFRVKNRGGGVGRVVYRVDGVEFAGRDVGIALPGSDTMNRRFDLTPGRHELTATVYNGKNQIESRSVSAIVNVAPKAQAPSLFVVAAGISRYRDSALNEGVKYASADARTVVERLQEQGKGLYSKITVYPLYDDQATRAGIEQTIAKVASAIQSHDVFVLYLAGHGAAFDGQYHFIPWEVRYTSNAALRQQSFDQEAFRKALAQIPAKKTLVLLDTCSSAAYSEGRALGDKASIDRFARITGRATLAAATQTALEGVENHGVFTYALLEGLSKVSDPDGLVGVTQLADYVVDKIPKITAERFKQEQIPMWIFQGQTFPIARKR